MIHAFDPEMVILVGGIMKSADVIEPAMQKFTDEYAWVGWGKVKIAAGTLGDSAALLGLGYLASIPSPGTTGDG
jgi:glucokinase